VYDSCGKFVYIKIRKNAFHRLLIAIQNRDRHTNFKTIFLILPIEILKMLVNVM